MKTTTNLAAFLVILVCLMVMAFVSCSDEIIVYKVSFDSQGGSEVPSIEGVKDGMVISEPAEPTKSGFAFAGWYKESGCINKWDFDTDIVEENTTLYTKWVVSYKVDFDKQRGSGGTDLVHAIYDSAMPAATAPTRTGYAFAGYYDQANGSGTQYYSASMESARTWDKTEDLTLYANWVVLDYTIIFDSQEGTAVSPIENVVHGSKISEPVSPTRSKHIFAGWYRDSSCTEASRYYFTTDLVISNMTLYAKWLPPYTVQFDSQGGEPTPEVIVVTQGDVVSEPAEPTRSGFVFDGWYSTQSYYSSYKWNFDSNTVTSNMTLYAKWIPLYLISFDSRRGSGIEAIEVKKGDKVREPKNPIKAGYVFNGWYKEIGCINQWSFDTNTVTESRTLYAKWTGIVSTVTFEHYGGTPNPTTMNITYGQPYGMLPSINRAGYFFSGWYTEVNGTGNKVENTTIVTSVSDHMLYAKWSADEHTLSFNGNGGEGIMNPHTVKTNEVIKLPKNTFTRDGYNFVGWAERSDGNAICENETEYTMGISDTVLYAKWVFVGQAGGLVFYENPNYEEDGWRYLEAAPATYEYSDKVWGGYRTYVGAAGTAIGTGESNTSKIVAAFGDAEPYLNKSDYAAKLCSDLVVTKGGVVYDDWFLPSRDELNQMYLNLKAKGYGGFSDDYYWSSSEAYTNNAWDQDFTNGSQDNYARNSGHGFRVRPVRAF